MIDTEYMCKVHAKTQIADSGESRYNFLIILSARNEPIFHQHKSMSIQTGHSYQNISSPKLK